MSTTNFDVIKEIPGYKVILKAVLKTQIQQLIEQLAEHTEEESVILTASVVDGTLSHLGSDSGKSFLDDHEDVKSQFLGFCLKKHHRKKQIEAEQQKEKERQESVQAMMTPGPHRGGYGGYQMTPRHQPYTVPRPRLQHRQSSTDYQHTPPHSSFTDSFYSDNQNNANNVIKQESVNSATSDGQGVTVDSNSSNSVPSDNITTTNPADSEDASNISVKQEMTDSEFDLQITGVEFGAMPQTSQENWAALGLDQSAASNTSLGDMGSQEGYNTSMMNPIKRKVPCPVCKKEFYDRSTMSRHYRIHTGEKKYQCEICFKRFTQSHGLKVHKVMRHMTVPDDNPSDQQ